jgi:hypothetical protein
MTTYIYGNLDVILVDNLDENLKDNLHLATTLDDNLDVVTCCQLVLSTISIVIGSVI